MRTNADGTGPEVGSADLMEHQYLHAGAILDPATGVLDTSDLTGNTLQQDVFNGTIDPGRLVAVREIVHPANLDSAGAPAVDTAVFSGLASAYTVSTTPAGAALGSPGSVTTVTDTTGRDGTDTLRNIERLQFADDATPGAPTGVTATGGIASATITWVAPVLNKVPQVVTGYSIQTLDAVTGAAVGALQPAPAGATSAVVTGLAPGSYQFRVQAENAAATPPAGPLSVPTSAVTVTADPVTPAAPVIGAATALFGTATATWAPPANHGASAITGFLVQVVDATTSTPVGAALLAGPGATSLDVGLVAGTYRFQVSATNSAGTGPASAASNSVVVVTPPAVPAIGSATAGAGQATVTWTAPTTDGGSPVTGFSVKVLDAAANQVGPLRPAGAGATSLVVTGLAGGVAVGFQVAALNAAGTSAFSLSSTMVTPTALSVPGAPTVGATSRGNGTVTVTWTAPADGGSPLTSSTVQVLDAAGVVVQTTRTAPVGATGLVVTGLAANTVHRFRVLATNAVGPGPVSGLTAAVRVITVPGAPGGLAVARGAAGGAHTFTASWTPPTNTGGTGVAITGYRVFAQAMSGSGAGATPVGAAIPSGLLPRTARSFVFTVFRAAGTNYRFQVQATNVVGTGPRSVRSANVVPR